MNRRVILLVFIPLLVLSCCAAGVAVGVLTFSPLRERVMAFLGLRPQTLAADLIPSEALFYLSVSYNLQAQPGYETIRKAYLDNPKVQEALKNARETMKREAKLDWDTDIAPWLGSEAGLALFPMSVEDLERNQVPLALLIASRDQKAAGKFLERVRQLAAEQGPPFEERTYQRARYWFRPPASGANEPPVILATVGDFVVIATHEKAFQALVDRASGQGEPLSRSPRFQRVLRELPPQAIVLGYVDYARMQELARQWLARNPGAPSLEELMGAGPSAEVLRATEGMGFSTELLPEGVRIQSVTLIDREKLSPQAKALLETPVLSDAMLRRVPEDVLAFVQYPQFGKLIEQMLDAALTANPDAQRQLRDIESAIGLRVREDLLAWMTGDVVLMVHSMLPATIPGLPAGLSALIGTDRPEAAREGLGRLETALQMGGLTFEDETLQGYAVRILRDPNGMRVAAYAIGPDAVGIGVPPEALVKSPPEGQPERAIGGNPRFQEVLRHLPARRSFLLFVDLQGIREMAEAMIPAGERETYDRDVRPFLEPVRGLGIAGEAATGSAVQRGVLFLQITTGP